jgi:hypothetical protein
MSKNNVANFRNAQKSTGPGTPEGKAAVAYNRSIHNLTGERVLLDGEGNTEYRRLSRALFDEFQPVTPSEVFLVEQILHSQYRLTRIAEMEQEVLHQMMNLTKSPHTPAARAADFMVSKCGAIDAHARIMRYEASIRRAYHQAVTQLRVMQNNRKHEAGTNRETGDQAQQAAITGLPAEILSIDSHPPLHPPENKSCDSNPISFPPAGLIGVFEDHEKLSKE